MKQFSERDLDNLASVLDHCDRVEATYQRITFLMNAGNC